MTYSLEAAKIALPRHLTVPACLPSHPMQVNRMLGFALNSKRLKDKLMDSSQLITEINIEYARTMNKIVFDASSKRGVAGCAATLVPLGEVFPQPIPKLCPEKGERGQR